MKAPIVLCLDTQSCIQPEIVGLDGERLDAQTWVDIVSTGEDARRELAKGDAVEEVWVVSSDDVDAINLAATLKGDCPDMRICLVGNGDGSMRSRAHTAAIDEVVSLVEFSEIYRRTKARFGTSIPPEANAGASQARLRKTKTEILHSPGEVVASAAGRAVPMKPEVPGTRNRGFLMPVVSGSGGVGKSTVSTLSAIIAQRAGYRTLLLDYDLQFGDVASALGVSDALAIDEIVAHPDLVNRLTTTRNVPAIVSAPSRIEAADSLVAETANLLGMLRPRFDVIIANTGAAWAEHHVAILEQSNVTLFLVDQRSSSLKTCKHALQLCSRCGIASSPFRFALNRCARNALFTSIDVSCALRGAPVFELRDGGPVVEEYFASGSALQLVEEGNELCASLAAALSKLLPEGEQKLGEFSSDARQRRAAKRRGRHFRKGGEAI